LRNDDLRLKFSTTALRDMQIVNKFFLAVSGGTFSNIAGNRNCCPTHLGNQPKFFIGRKPAGNHVYLSNELYAFFPHFQSMMRSRHFPSPPTRHYSLVTRHLSLVTRHSSLVTRHSSLFTRHCPSHSSLVTIPHPHQSRKIHRIRRNLEVEIEKAVEEKGDKSAKGAGADEKGKRVRIRIRS